MRLGGSMRRRRASRTAPSGKGVRKPGKRSGRKSGSRGGMRPGGQGRLLVLAFLAVLFGSGSGYLYATQVLFPAGEDQPGDFRGVPDLRSLPLADVETFLHEQGLETGEVNAINHPSVPEGWVLGQSPLPGQLAVAGGNVNLTVSLGPERRVVPDVTRLRADRALTVLQSTGFIVAVDSIEAAQAAGQVVATYPDAGAELALPSEVRLAVSLGPPMLPMPDLTGMQEELAILLLDSLGFEVGEIETRFRFGFNQGEVLGHFPVADALVPVGTEVHLIVGRRGVF